MFSCTLSRCQRGLLPTSVSKLRINPRTVVATTVQQQGRKMRHKHTCNADLGSFNVRIHSRVQQPIPACATGGLHPFPERQSWWPHPERKARNVLTSISHIRLHFPQRVMYCWGVPLSQEALVVTQACLLQLFRERPFQAIHKSETTSTH